MNRQSLFGSSLLFLTSLLPACAPYTAPSPDLLLTKVHQHKQSEHYAVLINGKPDLRHHKNVERVYTFLLDHDYSPEHIYILEGPSSSPQFPYPVDAVASRENISLLFDSLSDIITPSNTLFVYTTAHGDLSDTSELLFSKQLQFSTFFSLPEPYTSRRFVSDIQKVHPKQLVYVGDQCFSGGFVEALANTPFSFPVAAISSTGTVQYSFGNSFTRNLFTALDSSENTPFSLDQAFEFAKNKALESGKKQEPQMKNRGLEDLFFFQPK